MERIVLNIVKKSNTPFIKNATTPVTEFPPFLPYFDFKKGFIKYITDDDLINDQATSEEGFTNPFEAIKSMISKYDNAIAAYSVKTTLRVKLEKKTAAELDYVEGYEHTGKEITEEESENKADKCPECKAIIDAINAGKKAIGNIDLNNTAIQDAYTVVSKTDEQEYFDIDIFMDAKTFKIQGATSDKFFDPTFKVSMITVKEFKADTNAVKNYLNNIVELMKETIADEVKAKYRHYLLDYVADSVTNEIELHAYKVNTSELATMLEGTLNIAPIHRTETDILWIPIRYTKQPFLNAVRGVGRTSDISENYIDTVVGNIRIKKEDRVNNLDYVEHHNEIKWLEKVGFSKSADEIILYIK